MKNSNGEAEKREFDINLVLCNSGMDLLEGAHPSYPWPVGVQGGAIFHDKAEKY